MKKFISIIVITITCFSTYAQGDTMYIKGRHLYSAQGEKIVLRGMNIMSVWSDDKTGDWSMAEIAKTGANCARLVWTEAYGNKNELAQLIDHCIKNKMIAMPECHDATGDMSKLDICINFWKDSTLLNVMQRNKRWTLLNIGNEVGTHDVTAAEFSKEYQRAIDSIRAWGYTMPIVIDASGWGQNVDILIQTWQEITNHDPLKNVLFSAHSYWATTDNYDLIAKKALSDNIPLIIGEGPSITLVTGCKLLDYGYGLTLCGKNDIGWLSWSWGVVSNGDCKPYFDHTYDGIYGHWETQYAKDLVVNHPYGLMQTAQRPPSMFENNIVPVSGIHVYTQKNEYFLGDTLYLKTIIAPANTSDTLTKISYELSLNTENIPLLPSQKFYICSDTGTVNIKATHASSGFINEQSIAITSKSIAK